MKNNSRKTIIASLAITAMMFMGLAFITTAPPVSYDNNALGANESATVKMFTGDSFTYTPATNLVSTITAEGNGLLMYGGFLTFEDGVLSGTSDYEGTYSVVLTANWASDGLSQTAKQTLTFIVSDRIVINSPLSVYGVEGQYFEYYLDFTGPADTEVTFVYEYDTIGLEWDEEGMLLFADEASEGYAYYSLELYSPSSEELVEIDLEITIEKGLVITSPDMSYGYVGGEYYLRVTTSAPADISINSGYLPALNSLGLEWDEPDLYGIPYTMMYEEEYIEFSFTITATATISGMPVSTYQNHFMRIYAALEFTTKPTISNVTASTDRLVGSLSASIIGANSISIDWGDGTVTPYDVDLSGTELNATHEYASEGNYTAKITASNDFGKMNALAVLSASGEPSEGGDGDNESNDATLIFAVIAVISGIILGAGMVYRRFGIIILGIILLVAGILFFGGWL